MTTTVEDVRPIAHQEVDLSADEETRTRLEPRAVAPPQATEQVVEQRAEATEIDEEDSPGSSDHFTPAQIEALNARLERALIKTKPGGQGGLYIEAYTVVNHLNRIFGYGSWSRSLDREHAEEGPDGILYTAVVTLSVTAPDGTVSHHQDEGATLAPMPRGATNPDAIRASSKRTAKLGAISDGLKRAARSFGEQFANSLYDKTYIATRDAEERAIRSNGAARSTTPTPLRPPQASGGLAGQSRAQAQGRPAPAQSAPRAVATTDSAAPAIANADSSAFWIAKVRATERKKLGENAVRAQEEQDAFWVETHGIAAEAPALDGWDIPNLRAYGRALSLLPDLAVQLGG